MKDKGETRDQSGILFFASCERCPSASVSALPPGETPAALQIETDEDWLIERDVMNHAMLITMESEWRPDGAAEHCVSLRGGLRRLWRVLLGDD